MSRGLITTRCQVIARISRVLAFRIATTDIAHARPDQLLKDAGDVRRTSDQNMLVTTPTQLWSISNSEGTTPVTTLIANASQWHSGMDFLPNVALQPLVLKAPLVSNGIYARALGTKRYELTDHLGNVRVAVTDRKLSHYTLGTDMASDFYAEVTSRTDYYPFGSLLPRRNYSSDSYRFGFNGQEKDDEIHGATGTSYAFKYRMQDTRVGRFWSLDPLAAKGPGVSPYVFCMDNPIMLMDPDGAWPHPVHIRSFAPFKTFGGGFGGDNRGYSTALNVTSRLQHAFTVDPSARTFDAGNVWSNDSSHPIFGTGNGTPSDRADIKNFTSSTDKNGNSTVSFTADMAGYNPLVPSADIDVHTKFTLTENESAGTLNVNAVQTGDAFPSAETFIGDTKGNQLFIGVSPAIGNPYKSLPGDGDRKMMSANFNVTMDSKGVFTGVVVGSGKDAKTYSVSDWNKMMKAQPTTK